MKLNELNIEVQKGKVVLCKKNKRDNITQYKDVTIEIFNALKEAFENKDMTVKLGEKIYSFNIKEFTDEEYKQYETIKLKKDEESKRSFNNLLLTNALFSASINE